MYGSSESLSTLVRVRGTFLKLLFFIHRCVLCMMSVLKSSESDESW